MRDISRKLIGIVCLVGLGINLQSSACTSFKLDTKQGLFLAHSLNQGSVASVPGYIFINQRDTWKEGYSWEALTRVRGEKSPNLIWKSRFGSVTFNPFGKELPDGGMNEAGLYIWEMGFDAEYSTDENKPVLFQGQWMQYVLDNLGTVEEVIDIADKVRLDGWGWHYFIADKSGKTAIVDYVGGKATIYQGEEMPVPLCCNSVYPEAMKWLEQHSGFGGELEIEQVFEEIPRFIYGAKLLKEYKSQDPVQYSFHTLDGMSNNVRWSIVFDVAKTTVHFKTNLSQDIRYFSFTPEDFGRADGPLMLDIETPGPENIRDQFLPYSKELNRQLLERVLGLLVETEPALQKVLLDDQGIDLEGLAQSFMDKVGSNYNAANQDILGDWVGNVKYPAGDDWMELPMTLTLLQESNRLAGAIDDQQLIKNLAMSNISYNGGLLYFTIESPDTGDILQYQLSTTAHELRGAIEIRGRHKKATLSLHR